jgi:hypothetical protein
MRPDWRLATTVLAMICAVCSASAKLVPISRAELEAGRAEAEGLFERGDVEGLVALLDEAHLFIKTEAALHLGRLGARTVVERLRDLDEQYARFDCAPSGQFRVAIILIENRTAEEEKNALLHVATQELGDTPYAHSVIDAAGRELSRYEGVEIVERLEGVDTYGAQYTVLAHRCRGLALDDAIAKCVAILEAHETPMKAEAAQELLISYGPAAVPAVSALWDRVEERIGPTDEPFTIDRTIVGRCGRILDEIGRGAPDPDTEAPRPRARSGAFRVMEPWSSVAVMCQDGTAVAVGDARTFEILRADLSATDNASERFHLSVEVPYEPALDDGPWHVLWVDEVAYRQTSLGSSQDRSHSLGFDIRGRENAEAVGAHFSVEPRYRRHPGHRLVVEFVPNQDEFEPGGDVRVTLRIRNVGERTVAFQQGGRNRAPRDNQYVFSGELACEPIPDIGSRCHFGGLSAVRRLEPGEVFEDEVDLSDWFAFDRPGTYQLLGSYYMAFCDPEDDSWWTIWDDYATAEFVVAVGGDAGATRTDYPEASIDLIARGIAGRELDDLIGAATTRPWPGEGYPVLPALSTEMRGRLGGEIGGSGRVRAAYEKLDAARDNAEWFEGVAELEAEGAVWCLASCLVHPHEDVQIHALRALGRLGDRRVVPFLLTYAEYMAVLEGGSESATIHGIIHSSIAGTLSTLTAVRVEITGQDPEGLRAAITDWRRWLADQQNSGAP